MKLQKAILSSVIALALLSVGSVGYFVGANSPADVVSDAGLTDSISEAFENDQVTIQVHDSAGNLKSEQKTHNIITSAGAI